MGLDFNRSDVHFSYSGFNEFREKLALSIGISLKNMSGFGGYNPWSTVRSGLKPLLNHSDCDGDLSVQELRLIYPELRSVCEKWQDSLYKSRGLQLADDMEKCVRDKVSLEFC